MDLKLVKTSSVREHMDAHYRGEISYSKAVELINEDAIKQLSIHGVVERSEQLSCNKCGSKEIEVWDNHSNCKKCLNVW